MAKMTGRPTPWTTAVLVMLCAGAGAVIVVALTRGLPLAPELIAAPAPARQPDWAREAIEFEPPARDVLDEITARPLFSPSRRPFVMVEEQGTTEQVRALPSWQLIGVLVTDERRAALMQLVGEGRPIWVREGTEVQGWRVEMIEPSRVQLRAGERLEIVELRPDTAVRTDARLNRRRDEPVETQEAASEETSGRAEADEAESDGSPDASEPNEAEIESEEETD
jgi:hypothetical protein